MPMNIEFHIPPGSDREYVDAFDKMGAVGTFKYEKVNFAPYGELPVAEVLQQKEVQDFLGLGQQIVNEWRFQFPGNLAVTINRVPIKESIFNRVNVHGPDNMNKFTFATFVGTVQKYLGHTTLSNIGNLLGPSATKHFEAREAALHRLEALQDRMLEEMEDGRKRRDSELQTKEQALEAKYEKRHQEFDAEIKTRQEKQDERAAELDALRTELDDRAAKHARRQHYKDIKDKFKSWSETFAVTAGTSKMRDTVYWFTLGLLVVFLVGSVWFLFQSFASVTDTTHLVWTIGKQVAFTALFVSTAAFFINWNNQWFQRHANEEFRLKRMELDIDRASWFVEMAFEWKDEKGESIPAELIDRLTHGLFKEEGKEESVEPAESMMQMILGANRLKFQLAEGVDVEYEGKKLGKLAHQQKPK